MDAFDCWSPEHLKEELLVSKNNAIMAKTTLRELSLKAVVKNLGLIIRESSDAKRLKDLPSSVKTDLMKKAIDDFEGKIASEDLCCYVAALMHKELTILHLPAFNTIPWTWKKPPSRLMQFYNQLFSAAKSEPTPNLQRLLEAIGTECSGLKLLHVKTLRGNEPLFLTEGSCLADTFFRTLPRLTNLQILQLDKFRCDDWALQQFGMHGTNLVVLQVNLKSEVSSVGFQALSKLRQLRQFLFGEHIYSLELEEKFFLLCSQFLPQLKVSCRRFDKLDSVDNGFYNKSLQQPITLSLNNIAVSEDVQLHENLQLPELQSISLRKPMKDVLGLLERFSTVSALGLSEVENVPEDIMISTVLQSVGGRLRSLILYDVQQVLSLAQVFQLCPRLERFRISYCKFQDTSSKWPEKHFNCLEEVFVSADQLIPPGFILQVLKSAQLRKFEIHQYNLTKSEIGELLGLVRQRRVLKNIVRISWLNRTYQQPWNTDTEHFKLLLNTLQAVFPKVELIRRMPDYY